jgi:trehalose utilization protein
MGNKINVTVWNENIHEHKDEAVRKVYPDGIHSAIAGFLKADGRFGTIRTATLQQPENGLTDDVLNDTDVLLWWGHMAHGQVLDEVVNKVYKRVLAGMGLIVLHSGHASKIFSKLLGTDTGNLSWRDDGESERVWVIAKNHPITKGLGDYIEIPHTEMYGEPFMIPTPDELIFVNWYEGGNIFRGGCTFKRGLGKIFYFSPGHEVYPIYYQPEIQLVIKNGIEWAAPVDLDHPILNKNVTEMLPLPKES